MVGRESETGRDAPGEKRHKKTMLASFTPKTLMDCFLLYADPQRAVSVLGAVLAAILLFWGAVYFFLRYILPWINGR